MIMIYAPKIRPYSCSGAALDIKDIDHRFNSEHECTPLRLPRTMAIHGYLSLVFRPIELTVDNGAFYARKELYMASQEGIGKTYTCLCQRTDGQAVYVDVKLLGTTESPCQNSDILARPSAHARLRALFLTTWDMGAEKPLPKWTKHKPTDVSIGALEADDVCAYEREAPAKTTGRQEKTNKKCHGQEQGPKTRITEPDLISFLKMLCIYLERAESRQMLRNVKQTSTVCCIQKQLNVPEFVSLVGALEQELKRVVGELYWKRMQMYHREICKSLQEFQAQEQNSTRSTF
jgi:hypothetical protein